MIFGKTDVDNVFMRPSISKWKCLVTKSCPESLPTYSMVGPSKRLHMSVEKLAMRILSISIICNDEENASDMQHCTYMKLGVKQLCFPFNGYPGLNIDTKYSSDPPKLLK
jgi:hypothetical protein